MFRNDAVTAGFTLVSAIVLITGGAGFIGSNLVDRLLATT